MICQCPQCGHRFEPEPQPSPTVETSLAAYGRPYTDAPVNDPPAIAGAEMMRAACRMRGIEISWDGYVIEKYAAPLVRWKPNTMRNRRTTDTPIPFRKIGRHAEYAIDDLVAWLATKKHRGSRP